MLNLALLCLSYLLGSIPFGLLVGYRVKKIDIRKFGSGNIGATNVWRVVGKRWAILVFILDFLKGFIPILIVKSFLSSPENYIFILIAICSVCGHNWSIFLKGKGGKGVAVSLGAVSGLSVVFVNLWIVVGLSILVWLIILFTFRYMSLASVSGGGAFFIFSLIFSLPGELKLLSFLLFVFILIRHKKNIKDLLKRKESRFNIFKG
jgi:glycerol-3-phosphate acyltransferase PlsY